MRKKLKVRMSLDKLNALKEKRTRSNQKVEESKKDLKNPLESLRFFKLKEDKYDYTQKKNKKTTKYVKIHNLSMNDDNITFFNNLPSEIFNIANCATSPDVVFDPEPIKITELISTPLIIVGLPGMGKSTFAEYVRHLKDMNGNSIISIKDLNIKNYLTDDPNIVSKYKDCDIDRYTNDIMKSISELTDIIFVDYHKYIIDELNGFRNKCAQYTGHVPNLILMLPERDAYFEYMGRYQQMKKGSDDELLAKYLDNIITYWSGQGIYGQIENLKWDKVMIDSKDFVMDHILVKNNDNIKGYKIISIEID